MLKIGWLGTGVMGSSMAKHLFNAGNTNLSVFNRTKSKTDSLTKLGATFQSPLDIAKECDVIFTMLGYPSDVENIILNKDTGLVHHMKPGSLLIDHTTSTPSLAQEIYETAKQRGIESIDAPVSGGDIGAKNGTLVTMVGGNKSSVEKAKQYFDCYSSKVEHLGDAGSGQHAKCCNQIMIASSMIGTCEALIYASKAGLPLSKLIDLLNGGGAASFTLGKLAPRMLQRDFAPGFYVEHFVKDLGIALDEAHKMNISLPGTSLAQQFYIAMKAQGMGRDGTQGLLKVLEQFNNHVVVE